MRGLGAADVLLLSRLSSSDVNSTPEAAIDRAMQVLPARACSVVLSGLTVTVQLITGVLKEGGNVVVPTYPSGIVRNLGTPHMSARYLTKVLGIRSHRVALGAPSLFWPRICPDLFRLLRRGNFACIFEHLRRMVPPSPFIAVAIALFST